MDDGYLDKARRRFAKYCRFDPETGCVVWTGGTSSGRAGEARYPAFWFNGGRVPGHRFAAEHIHGLRVKPDNEAQHTCPNTLCVQHVTTGVHFSGNPRQHWLLIALGYDPLPDEDHDDAEAAPPEDELPGDEDDPRPERHCKPDWLKALQGDDHG